MKKSCFDRAKVFCNQIAPFIETCSTFSEFRSAVIEFNTLKHRNVKFTCGYTRYCLITSDYVIKWNKNLHVIHEFGGIEDEVAMYERAVEDEKEHLFAPCCLFEVNGMRFEIMERIKTIGNCCHFWWSDKVSRDDEYYICDNVRDVHEENWGVDRYGKVVLIDYAAT